MTTIKSVHAKLNEWTGPTVLPLAIFCSNASDRIPDMAATLDVGFRNMETALTESAQSL